MATRESSTTVAFSQMQPLTVVNPSVVVPVVFGVNNYRTTVGAINALNTKATIGLARVDNIAALDMPISRDQQDALDLKMDKTGMLPAAQVEGLNDLLDTKFDKDGLLPVAQVDGLALLLDGKLDTDGVIAQTQVEGLVPRLEALETDPILAARISDFEPAVLEILAAQPAPEQDVVQGAHTW